jgi:hypothetical protein
MASQRNVIVVPISGPAKLVPMYGIPNSYETPLLGFNHKYKLHMVIYKQTIKPINVMASKIFKKTGCLLEIQQNEDIYGEVVIYDEEKSLTFEDLTYISYQVNTNCIQEEEEEEKNVKEKIEFYFP